MPTAPRTRIASQTTKTYKSGKVDVPKMPKMTEPPQRNVPGNLSNILKPINIK